MYFIIFNFLCFERVFNAIIILLLVVGYEMIIANLALHTSLLIYYLISNACSWNNRYLLYKTFIIHNDVCGDFPRISDHFPRISEDFPKFI